MSATFQALSTARCFAATILSGQAMPWSRGGRSRAGCTSMDELRVWMMDMEHEIDGRGSAWPDVSDEDILREFLDRPVRVPGGAAMSGRVRIEAGPDGFVLRYRRYNIARTRAALRNILARHGHGLR
jgi:hypothetical protein